MAISALLSTPRCTVRPSPAVALQVQVQAVAAVAAAQYLDPVAPLEVQAADLVPAKARVNLAVVLSHLARTAQTATVRIRTLR